MSTILIIITTKCILNLFTLIILHLFWFELKIYLYKISDTFIIIVLTLILLKQEKIDPNDLRNAIIDQSSKGNLLSEENSPSVGSR